MKLEFGGFTFTAESEIKNARASEQRVLSEIERLGLETNAWELDVKGYTVLRPDQVAPKSFIAAIRAAMLKSAENRYGLKIDPEAGLGREGDVMSLGPGIQLPGILVEDPIFEQALMNERVLALISYLLGESCELSSMGGIMKSQGNAHLELHADLVGTPPPFPPFAQVANATWLITDYTRENGCTCFAEGTHRRCRPPTPTEATDISLFTPVEAPAGSVLIWGSNVWHGAMPRTAPGLRMSLLCFFSRWYLYKAEKDLAAKITPEMLQRNPPRFRRLLGLAGVGPAFEEHISKSQCAYSQFA